MISIEVRGTFPPLKKDGATPATKKKWKKTDTLYLLRKALMNKLRSKHWRVAHAAKKNWMESATKNAKICGDAVQPPAIVIVQHSLPGGCDIDAPVKVLLDAFQSILLTTGDDKDIETLVLKRYSCSRGAGEPLVKIFAYSRETELEEAFIKQAGVVSDDAIEEREEKPEDILT
tara:strand:+ start:476 stop:997 length:522 start_codon:yes stop_codon:yes gene_type:complete